jgi:hypothetical protein
MNNLEIIKSNHSINGNLLINENEKIIDFPNNIDSNKSQDNCHMQFTKSTIIENVIPEAEPGFSSLINSVDDDNAHKE